MMKDVLKLEPWKTNPMKKNAFYEAIDEPKNEEKLVEDLKDVEQGVIQQKKPQRLFKKSIKKIEEKKKEDPYENLLKDSRETDPYSDIFKEL